MPRPPSPRRIGIAAAQTGFFKPAGKPLREIELVHLDLDGLEALRLADLDGLYHEAAAERMGVSRATFGRVLAEARSRVADALVNGKAISIGGGKVVENQSVEFPCPVHWGGRRRGRGCRCRPGWTEDPSAEPHDAPAASDATGEGDER